MVQSIPTNYYSSLIRVPMDLDDIENGEVTYEQGEYIREEYGDRIFGAVTDEKYTKTLDIYELPDGRYLNWFAFDKTGFTYWISNSMLGQKQIEDEFPEGYTIDHNPRDIDL